MYLSYTRKNTRFNARALTWYAPYLLALSRFAEVVLENPLGTTCRDL